jgi:hypothetical protein
MVGLTMGGAVLVLVVVFALASRDKSQSGKPKDLGEPVGRIDAGDLVRWYRQNGGAHHFEGKRIIIRLPVEVYYELDAERHVCALWGSEGGFNRPKLILRADKPHTGIDKPGKSLSETMTATLRGLRRYQDFPHFKRWADLTPPFQSLEDRFVYLESPRPHSE